MPAGAAALAVNVSNPEGFVSDAAYFSCRPVGRPLTDTSAVSLVEVMLMGTTTCVPSCGTTTVETGSETVIGTGTIMEPAPQLHPAAAKANPTKATPQARPLDRNMECMKDSAQSAAELPEDPYLGAVEKSAHEQRRSQIGAGDYTQPFWPHQCEKSRSRSREF